MLLFSLWTYSIVAMWKAETRLCRWQILIYAVSGVEDGVPELTTASLSPLNFTLASSSNYYSFNHAFFPTHLTAWDEILRGNRKWATVTAWESGNGGVFGILCWKCNGVVRNKSVIVFSSFSAA